MTDEKYPRGKLKEDDEGVLETRICADQGRVIIDFGKSVVWIGLDADLAEAMAQILLYRAKQARRQAQEMMQERKSS